MGCYRRLISDAFRSYNRKMKQCASRNYFSSSSSSSSKGVGYKRWYEKRWNLVMLGFVGGAVVMHFAAAPENSTGDDLPLKPEESEGKILRSVPRAGWLLGKKNPLPGIVKAGHPVLHEPARAVQPEEIGSDQIQKIIDDMVNVMRKAPGVGLAAPQIGIPLRIIVLEYKIEYLRYTTKEEIKEQDTRPFDLLVVINPKLEKKGDKSACFFEGCLSVDGFRAMVERHSEVEVTGLDRFGQEIKVEALGWQARIFQHEYDHLDGMLYVDKMVPRTFRSVENFDLPLATGCPKMGVR